MYKKDLISIVVPTFNNGDYLKEFIYSLIAQVYKQWELIIIDDGSDDGTDRMIAEEFTDERIYFYQRPKNIRKGANSCRNFGKSKATGEFICFFDADDLVRDTCLEKRISCIKRYGTDYCIFPSSRFSVNPDLMKKTHVGIASGIDILTSLLNNYYQHTVWTNIYRAEAIRDIWWDDNVFIYQDFDFSVQCICKGLTFHFSEDIVPDYFYRVNESCDTISKKNVTSEKLASTIYLFNKILNSLSVFSNQLSYKKDFIQYHLWYYSQIVQENQRNAEDVFLRHVKVAYNGHTVFFFKMLRPLISCISHRRLQRLIIMLLFYIFFRRSKISDMYYIVKLFIINENCFRKYARHSEQLRRI